MPWLLYLPISWALSTVALAVAPRILAGIRVDGWKVAARAAAVYAALYTLGRFGLWLVLPLSSLIPGPVWSVLCFVLVGIPALYCTEAFVSGYEVQDLKTAAKAGLLMAGANLLPAVLI